MSQSELTKLSKKIDLGFAEVNKKLINHDDSFERFFKYIEKRFDTVDKHFGQVHEEIADLKGAVGELAGQIKDYHQEMIMLARKVDRMERWIHEIAKETGVKLSYE